jgi:hypothetical protein
MRSSLVSAAVVGLVIGAVAVAVLFRPHPPSAIAQPVSTHAVGSTPPAASLPVEAPLPPDAARSSALFDRNRSMPADPDLASEYEDLNVEYFSNILPAPEVRWESGLAEIGPMIADGFTVQGLTDGRMILINPAIERDADQRRRALCHEMVHMAVWMQDKAHGPVFQERLRQLSLRGAFKGIVATDQEKDAALTALQRLRGEIDTDERALLRGRESLDRTSQDAVEAYNARVRRHQADIGDYNHRVEQYNLMVSYPDGLARERLTVRADGTMTDR